MTLPLILITPDAELYLTQWGHGDDHRFAALFQKAWNRVPATKRSLLTRYWGHQGYAYDLVCGEKHPAGPNTSTKRIELVRGWKDRDGIISPEERNWSQESAGEVFACGYLIRFCASCVDLMPPAVVQDLVAEELARCWQYADSIVNRTCRQWDLPKLNEEAKALVSAWGFNSDSVARWFAQDREALAGSVRTQESLNLSQALSVQGVASMS